MSTHVRHVFLVDDESLIIESLAMILTHEGFKVSTFTNPLDALEHMKVIAPDVLISDVMMPQLSGVDLAIEVRGSHPECAILLFSGQAINMDWLQKARNCGHNFRILAKPVHPRELLREIERLKPISRPN